MNFDLSLKVSRQAQKRTEKVILKAMAIEKEFEE